MGVPKGDAAVSRGGDTKGTTAGSSGKLSKGDERPPSPPKLPLHLAFARPTQSLMNISAQMKKEREELALEKAHTRVVDPGLRETDDVEILKTKLRHKYHTITAGWREGLDLRSAHFVGEADWFKALRNLGFAGNAQTAWKALSGEKKQVTLADLDSHAAALLSKFYKAYTQEVGKVCDMLKGLDSLRATEKCFEKRCAVLKESSVFRREPINVTGVFALLPRTPGGIIESDLDWLESYCTRGLGRKEKDKEKAEQTLGQDPSSPVSPALRREDHAATKRRRGLREFQRLLSHRCGGIIPAWRRLLDREGNGAVALEDFEFVVEAIEFETPAADLWEELVGPDGDELTLKEWCPQGEAAVREFKARCIECFGSLKVAFEELKAAKKPLVTRDEWSRFCGEVRLRSNHNLLFDYLDSKGAGFVPLIAVDMKCASKVFGVQALSEAQEAYAEMDPLPRKPSHVTIDERAKDMCAVNKWKSESDSIANGRYREALIQVLDKRWESPIRAWGAVLDPGNRGKLTKDEFLTGVSVAGFTGDKSSLWKELGLKDTQTIRLKDLAPEALEECKEFKLLSGKQLGRMITAMEAAGDANAKKHGADLDEKAFKKLCTRIGYKGDLTSLMKHFDPAGKGVVNSKNLRCFHEEKKDEKACLGMVKKHYQLKKENFQARIEEVKIAKTAEVLARQAELLNIARSKRDDKVEPEKARRLLLSMLSRKFGSIARAWKRALNPSGMPELNVTCFVDGLKRAGVLPALSTDEQVNRYHKLFHYLVDIDEQASGLKLSHLDPKIEESIEEFKVRCCERFGSIWLAFDKFDPEGTGLITTDTFRLLCQEIKLTDGIHRLCHYYDPESEHEIQLENIDKDAADDAKDACEERKEAVQKKLLRDKRTKREHMTSAPRYMGPQASPDAAVEKLVKSMRNTLVKKYGTMARAWREAFDTAVDQVIDFDAFESGIAEAGIETEAADLWQAMGREMVEEGDGNNEVKEKKRKERGPPKTKLSLVQIEPNYEADLKEFDLRIKERWGSYLICFKELVSLGAVKLMLDSKGFKELCHDCQYRGNAQRLFDFFAADGKRVHFKVFNKEAAEIMQKELTGKGPVDPEQGGEDEEAEGQEDADVSDEESIESAPHASLAPVFPRPDPAVIFRELLLRRFGSSVKAWRVLDAENRGVLRFREFKKNLPLTGYSGGPSLLWKALVVTEATQEADEADEVDDEAEPADPEELSVGKKKDKKLNKDDTSGTFSLKDLDSDLFARLATLRRCSLRVYSKLSDIFEDSQIAPTGSMALENFRKLCKKVGMPKPWNPLFEDLAVKDRISPAEVQLLGDWIVKDGQEHPQRQAPTMRAIPSFTEPFPPTSLGSGPLVTWMQPRPLNFTKSRSLPALKPLRPLWNERHSVRDHMGNKDENMIHMAIHVNAHFQEKVRLKIAHQMKQVPTLQWLAENYPREDRDYVGDDDDGDD